MTPMVLLPVIGDGERKVNGSLIEKSLCQNDIRIPFCHRLFWGNNVLLFLS